MRARKCKAVSYTYSGNVIEECVCNSIRMAKEEKKRMAEALSCYLVAIYDAETCELIY